MSRAQYGAEQMELVDRGVKNETSTVCKEREFHIIEEQPTQEGNDSRRPKFIRGARISVVQRGFISIAPTWELS